VSAHAGIDTNSERPHEIIPPENAAPEGFAMWQNGNIWDIRTSDAVYTPFRSMILIDYHSENNMFKLLMITV
jgi:hypothetical protein